MANIGDINCYSGVGKTWLVGCPDSAKEAYQRLNSLLGPRDSYMLTNRNLLLERSSNFLTNTETITVSRIIGGNAHEVYEFTRERSRIDITFEEYIAKRVTSLGVFFDDWDPMVLSRNMYFGPNFGSTEGYDFMSMFNVRCAPECGSL